MLTTTADMDDQILNNLLSNKAYNDLISGIQFLDTDTGSRNNTLIDPIKTVQASLEDVEVPEGMELKTIGVGPNERQVLIQKDRWGGGDNILSPINRFLAATNFKNATTLTMKIIYRI